MNERAEALAIDHDYPLATAVSDIDEVDQLVWGLRHINDLVLRRVNANYSGGSDTDYSDTGDRVGDQYLSDTQFSVVASVASTGALLERVEYDSYGQAQHHWPEGITAYPGGGVVAPDYNAAHAAEGISIGTSGYLADADLDRDGTVETADANAINAKVGTAGLPTGRISAYGNAVGWCGYAFNPGTNLYSVRFRHYEPTPGIARWIERDPAGYMDGASLYGYGGLMPTMGSDPSGLLLGNGPGLGVMYRGARGRDGKAIELWYHAWRSGDRGKGGEGGCGANREGNPEGRVASEAGRIGNQQEGLGGVATLMRETGEAAQDVINVAVPPIGVVLETSKGNYGTAATYAGLSGLGRLSRIASEARPSSRALGRALEAAAGEARPAGSAAHHIVAGKATIAESAREKLERFGIGINDAENGVFLAPDFHNRLHTITYYEAVNEAIAGTKTRQEALEVLESIRKRLQSGWKP